MDQSFGATKALPRTVVLGVSAERRSEGLSTVGEETWVSPTSSAEVKTTERMKSLRMGAKFTPAVMVRQGDSCR